MLGDVVICHHKLAHRGGPNYSHEIRRMCYFRINHKDHERFKQDGRLLENIWLEFDGMKDVI
jgi:hypothetical protein